MNCLNPIDAWILRGCRSKNGGKVVSFTPPKNLSILNFKDGALVPDLQLPCGKCVLCRDAKRRQWINRLIAETFTNDASFLTLTINDDFPQSPDKSIIQKFLKRFRIQCKRNGKSLKNFRYFFVNEYGSKSFRLHYHAIFFGVDLLRDPFFRSYLATHKKDSRGRVYPVYSSRFIESIWPFGFNSVDRCTDKSIRYVAKYVSKFSSIGDDAESVYSWPVWKLFSRRIGSSLLVSGDSLTPLGRSVFASGKFLLSRDGFPSRSPRYLDRYVKLFEPALYESVKASRRAFAKSFKQDVGIVKGRASDILSKQTTQKRNEIL